MPALSGEEDAGSSIALAKSVGGICRTAGLSDLGQSGKLKENELPICGGAEVYLARFLGRQNVSARKGLTCRSRRAVDQPIHAAPIVGQEPTETDDLAASAARQPTQTNALCATIRSSSDVPHASGRRSLNQLRNPTAIPPPLPTVTKTENRADLVRQIPPMTPEDAICASLDACARTTEKRKHRAMPTVYVIGSLTLDRHSP